MGESDIDRRLIRLHYVGEAGDLLDTPNINIVNYTELAGKRI